MMQAVAGETLSLTEAARVSGIGKDSLRTAIDDGRLHAEVARRDRQARRYGTRTHFQIARAELERFLASLPTCPYPGCDRPGASALGFCCGGHAQGVRMKGVPRPDVAAKVSAARRGRTFGPRGYCTAVRATWARLLASPAGDELRQKRSEQMREWWRAGVGAPPVVLKLRAGGLARQRWLGAWGGRRAGRLGGRKRTYTDEQVELARTLRQRDPGIGRERLARLLRLTPRQARGVLAELDKG